VKRVLKWIGITLGALVILAGVAIYGVSEYRMRQTFDIAAAPITVPTDSSAIAAGRHILETRGCAGCHGPGLSGKVFFDEPWLARLIAPNVPKAIRAYSDPELARLLRHGVRPNGRGVAVMPSSMFYHLDDEDLSALIAYLRTLPETEGKQLPPNSMRLLARIGLTVGQYKVEPREIAHDAPRAPKGPEPAALGRYIAMSSCTECHGQRLQGEARGAPALMIVGGYTPSQFARLMREGVPKDGKERKTMSPVARGRFSHFTEEEVNALYAYLAGRASAPN
jgi:mono/diheme cytochrome c family protein